MDRYVAPVVVFLLFCAAAALMFLSPPPGSGDLLSDSAWEKSALGPRGLELLLQDKGITVAHPDRNGKTANDSEELRIVTLRDGTAPDASGNVSDRPVKFGKRLAGQPLLFVLSKWTDDVATGGNAKPGFLIGTSRAGLDLALMGLTGTTLLPAIPGFTQEQAHSQGGQLLPVTLFEARLFDRMHIPARCREILGLSQGALMLACNLGGPTYVLSDPDLINNHGLALGENVDTAMKMMHRLLSEVKLNRVSIDINGRGMKTAHSTPETAAPRSSSAADFTRFFAYPFSVIWGVALLVTLMLYWRGAWRFGAVMQDKAEGLALSKTSVVEAEARLLRRAGNDGLMTAQFVRAMLIDKAAQVFGPNARHSADIDRLYAHLSRRDERQASELRRVATDLMEKGPSMRASDLHKNLDQFQTLLGRADFGS